MPEPYFPPRIITGDDYYTPAPLIEVVRKAMGGIDLDPASHPVANRVVGAGTFYQAEDNGLKQPWFGRVWINPPFSRWPEFSVKLLDELARGEISEVLALMSTPTISALYINSVFNRFNLMIRLPGRLDFYGPYVEDGSGGSASSGHVILYFGGRVTIVADIFKRHLGATCLVPI
jgi:hypothetical protein